MTKRRTKPAKRIWAVWYESDKSDSRLFSVYFRTRAEAIRDTEITPLIKHEIVCYERRSK